MKTPFFKTFLMFAVAVFASAAIAQQYKWVDKNGRTQYGDVPPPGVKAAPLRGPPAPSAPAEAAAEKDAAKDGKAARKGPLTPAEQDAEFRKRQKEQAESADKAEKERAQVEAKRANCEQSQAYLRSLESGARVASTNAAGERVIMEDAQRANEIARVQRVISETCK